MAEIIPVKMIPVKLAYKISRDNSKEIYKGFSFKRLSDATSYYVRPDNQPYDGTAVVGIALDDVEWDLTDRLKEIFPDLVSCTDLKRPAPSLIKVAGKALDK